MAFDLKMEIFAYTLFHRTWVQKGIEKESHDIYQIYGEEFCKIQNVSEACEGIFISGIELRRMMFSKIYMEGFTDKLAKNLKSLSDCYYLINYMFDRFDLFGHLRIFERMFATCGFVLDFCTCFYEYNKVDIVKYGHVLWAMYFDKYTEEFYKEGGWKELRNVAESYHKIIDIVFYFGGETIYLLNGAIENYCDFKNSIHYDKFKNMQKKKVHVSKLWIKHRIQRLDSHIKIPVSCDYSINASVAENLLEKLIKLHDLISGESAFSEKMECTETPIEHVGNRNNSDDLQTTIFSLINEDISSNDEKVSKEKSVEASYLSNSGNQTEIARRREITSTSQVIKFNEDETFSPYILPTQQFIDSFIDNLYSSSTEMEKKIPTSPEVLLTDQSDKFLNNKEAELEVMEATKFFKETEDVSDNDKEISNEKSVEMSNILPAQQSIDSFIDNLYSSSTEMQKKIPTSAEVLLTDQSDKSLNNKDAKLEVMEATKVLAEHEDVSGNRKSEEMSYSKNGDDRTDNSMRMKIRKNRSKTKKQIKTPTATEVSSTKQIDKTFDYSNNVKNVSNFCSENQERNGELKKVNNDKNLESNCYSKKGEEQSEISKGDEIISTSIMAVPECNVKITPDILNSKVLDFPNHSGNIDDGIEKTENEAKLKRVELRKEQDDRGINFFLRMILILNERQRAKFVFQELLVNEETPQNVQAVPKKKKKKKKKKTKNDTLR